MLFHLLLKQDCSFSLCREAANELLFKKGEENLQIAV
jgi:hypothetical protein